MLRQFSIIFVQIYKYIATKRFDLACIAAHPARRGDNAGLYVGLERPALAGPGRAGYGHILRAYREQGRKQHDLATPGPAPLSHTNSTLSRRIPAPPTAHQGG